jgi:hypothetical protein
VAGVFYEGIDQTIPLFAGEMGLGRQLSLVCSLVCVMHRTAYSADTPVRPVASEVTAAPTTTAPPRVTRPVAVVGSVVPGLILHGAGSWLSGDDETATRLLVTEGVGLGLTAGSIAGLALTGAARNWAGLFASTAILGAGAFGVSFLADVYRTAAPEGFGKNPGGLPWGSTEVGVLWINNPRLDYGPVVRSHGELRSGLWSATLTSYNAPRALHQYYRIENGFRLWGAPAERRAFATGGSHVTAFVALESSTFGRPDYATKGAEGRLAARVDSEQWLPKVHGAFFEAELGYSGRRTEYNSTGNTLDDTLLLGGFGFGAYHGDPTTCGGETRLFYNHRHDGYVGGLLQAGLGSGTIGSFGLETSHFLTPTWGLRLRGEIGAAAVVGLHLVARAWATDGRLGFLTFD